MTPMNSRDLAEGIIVDLETRIVPMIHGNPAIGKSAMITSIGNMANLEVRAEHLSSKEPTDINGFPDTGGKFATFKTFENFPTEDMEVPKGKNGWLLFLDELNSASIETQAASYSLILDRKVGMKKLHPDCYVVAAGNLKTDNAIVNTMSSALTSRMVHYKMILEPEVFLEDVVKKFKWDSYVASFLEWKPEAIHEFDPAKAEDPYASPRTWDMVQQRIATQKANGGYDNNRLHNRAAAEGLVGQVRGRDLISFIRTLGQIPTTQEVIDDPLGITVPTNRGMQYALTIQLRDDASAQNLQDLYTFVQRLEPDLRVTFIRGIVGQNGIARSHPVIMDAQRNLRRR